MNDVFGDSRTFLRQCGQTFSRPIQLGCGWEEADVSSLTKMNNHGVGGAWDASAAVLDSLAPMEN